MFWPFGGIFRSLTIKEIRFALVINFKILFIFINSQVKKSDFFAAEILGLNCTLHTNPHILFSALLACFYALHVLVKCIIALSGVHRINVCTGLFVTLDTFLFQ
jgi:hypothetical protein